MKFCNTHNVEVAQEGVDAPRVAHSAICKHHRDQAKIEKYPFDSRFAKRAYLVTERNNKENINRPENREAALLKSKCGEKQKQR